MQAPVRPSSSGVPQAAVQMVSLGTLAGRSVAVLQTVGFNLDEALATLSSHPFDFVQSDQILTLLHGHLSRGGSENERKRIQDAVLSHVAVLEQFVFTHPIQTENIKLILQKITKLRDPIAFQLTQVQRRALYVKELVIEVFAKFAEQVRIQKEMPLELQGKIPQEDYAVYCASLPIMEALLLDTLTESEREALRRSFTEEQQHIIQQSVAFAWQNKALNEFLHAKTLRSNAEDFLHQISFLPPPRTQEEITKIHTSLQQHGIFDVIAIDQAMEASEKQVLSSLMALGVREKSSHSAVLKNLQQALLVKPYLPAVRQRLDGDREESIQAAIQWVEEQIQKPRRGGRQMYGSIYPQFLQQLKELEQQIKQAKVCFDRIEKMAEDAAAGPLLSLPVWYQIEKYCLSDSYKKLFGAQVKLFGDSGRFEELLQATIRAETLHLAVSNAYQRLCDCMPVDISIHHLGLEQRLKGDMKKSAFEVRQEHRITSFFSMISALRKSPFAAYAYLTPFSHAEMIFAKEGQVEAFGVYDHVEQLSIEAGYTFSNILYRPDFYHRLNKETQEALKRHWKCSDDACRKRIVDKQSKSIWKIVQNPQLYSQVLNTGPHLRKAFVHRMMPDVVKKTGRCVQKMFGKQPAQDNPLLTPLPVGKFREMFCSEFASSVLTTVEHEVELWLQEELSSVSDLPRPFLRPILPIERGLETIVPGDLQMFLEASGVERVPQAAISRVLFGPQERNKHEREEFDEKKVKKHRVESEEAGVPRSELASAAGAQPSRLGQLFED